MSATIYPFDYSFLDCGQAFCQRYGWQAEADQHYQNCDYPKHLFVSLDHIDRWWVCCPANPVVEGDPISPVSVDQAGSDQELEQVMRRIDMLCVESWKSWQRGPSDNIYLGQREGH